MVQMEKVNFGEEEIRMLTANSDAFDFWEDEREDIYQDYLDKINRRK